MHPLPASPSTPFLQKFNGKQQKINKDGLLQLLQPTKLDSRESDPPQGKNKAKTSVSPQAANLKEYSSGVLKDKTSPRPPSTLRKHISSSQQLKVDAGERILDGMAFHLMKRSESNKPFQSNQFKLPPIGRSSSQNTNLSKNGFILNAEIVEDNRSIRKKSNSGSFYSKHSERLTRQMEIDQYVLRHMEFLNKFQKQLVSNRLSQGSKSFKQ